MKRLLFNSLLAAGLAAGGAVAAHAQRTATVSDQQPGRTGGVTVPKPPPAPASVKAKYEGGLVGYGKTEGTLNFDDVNSRLVFKDKKTNKEMFSLPYEVVIAAWADSKSARSTAGTVVASTVPFGGLPAMLMNNTTRYLILQYRDPDTRAEGSASFKFDNKEMLASVLYTFAEKAGLTQRGEGFVRSGRTAVRTSVTNN